MRMLSGGVVIVTFWAVADHGHGAPLPLPTPVGAIVSEDLAPDRDGARRRKGRGRTAVVSLGQARRGWAGSGNGGVVHAQSRGRSRSRSKETDDESGIIGYAERSGVSDSVQSSGLPLSLWNGQPESVRWRNFPNTIGGACPVSGPAKFSWTVVLLGLRAEMDLSGPVSLVVAMVLNT